LLWLLAALLTRPFVESGLIDDFSYVKSAFVFADTHRLVYNGWATATIGWQIAWGGIFAHLFGHTYTAVRIANFVTSFATVWIAQAALRRSGLSRRNAAIGALALALCPLFLPMSVSFMSDISGLFSILVCYYCCLRALQSEEDRHVLAWLVAASLLSIVGSTARQIAWMSPLVMAPSAAWLLRRRRGVLPVATVLWLLSAVVMLGSMRWFAHQPLSVPEGVIQGAINAKSFRELLGNITAAIVCLLFMLVPLLAAWTAKRLRTVQVGIVAVGTLIVAFLVRFLTAHGMEKGWAPWTGDILDKIGMLGYRNAWTLGIEPSPFALWARVLLSLVVIAFTLWFTFAIIDNFRKGSEQNEVITWRSLLIFTLPFLATYFLLLCPRAMWGIVIDRYLLPPIAFGILFLLRMSQERIGPRLPVVSYVLLGLYALFAIAGTHDWIAMHRARVEAVQRLQSQGADRLQIEAGYQIDGMAQIDRAGAVIDPRVHYPAGMDTHPWSLSDLTHGCREILNPHTPALRPHYFLSASETEPSLTPGEAACLVPSSEQPQVYTTWLPPFHRRVYILQRP
jgi:hypothetical protein